MEYSGHLSALAISNEKHRSGNLRAPLGEVVGSRYRFSALESLQRRRTGSHPPKKYNCDRFIPDRSSMDTAMANQVLSSPTGNSSPSKEAYRRALRSSVADNSTRILSFGSKPPPPPPSLYREAIKDSTLQLQQCKPAKQRRHIPQTAERTLDAPELVDDYYLNLLDWGSSNVLAIALGSTVYLWDATSGSTSELVTVDEEETGPVTSVGWAPDGKHIAIGLNNASVQLWDSCSNRLLRTMKEAHRSRIGALAWNGQILTTGGMDAQIFNHDVRIRSPVVQTYKGHTHEVCGLKWSGNGQQLASGGNDNLLHIWDVAAAAPPPTHRLEDHTAAVKALAWCPFQANLLASGGGGSDRTIKFWNTQTGACLNSVETGSQVCSLQWNRNERELLSSHGFTQNQLCLWKYPSMTKMAELTGHTSRVLFTAVSPDGCTVASAAGDETLRFWNVFRTPEEEKKKKKGGCDVPFSRYHIR